MIPAALSFPNRFEFSKNGIASTNSKELLIRAALGLDHYQIEFSSI